MTKVDDNSSDTNATASSESESKPTLDSLLAEWSEANKASASKSSPDKATEDRLAAVEGELTDRIINDEIVPHIKGELDIPDKIVKGYLAESAAENPKLNELFQNRKANPKQLQEALDAVRDEFQKDMGVKKSESKSKKPNDNADDKGLAAAAALAKQTQAATTGFDGLDWGAMTDSEFAMKKSAVFKAVGAGQLQ